MLHRPGRAPREEQSLLDRLLDCHDRIRAMTELAGRLARPEGASEEEVAEVAARLRRYFTRALPHHVRDEEESLWPRLAGLGDGEALAALERMKFEHGEHDEPVRELVALCAAIERDPAAVGELGGALERVAATLRSAFSEHLAHEEDRLFPLLGRLDEPAHAAILAEMEARRDDGEGGRGEGRGGRGAGGGRGR